MGQPARPDGGAAGSVPARRQGRDVLTPKGEQVLTRVLEKGATDDEAPTTGPGPAAPPSGLAG